MCLLLFVHSLFYRVSVRMYEFNLRVIFLIYDDFGFSYTDIVIFLLTDFTTTLAFRIVINNYDFSFNGFYDDLGFS